MLCYVARVERHTEACKENLFCQSNSRYYTERQEPVYWKPKKLSFYIYIYKNKKSARPGMKPYSKPNRHHTLILSLVVVAGLVWNAMVMGIHPNTWVVSTFTGSCVSTINHILNREVGRRPCTFSLYVDSICKDKKVGFVSGVCGWLYIATSVKTVSSSLNL